MKKIYCVKMKWSWTGYQIKVTACPQESRSLKYPSSSYSIRKIPLQNPDFELYLTADTAQEAILEAKQIIKKSYFLRAKVPLSRRKDVYN